MRLVFRTSSGVVNKPEVAPAIDPLIELTTPGNSNVDSLTPLLCARNLMLVIFNTSYRGNWIALNGISLSTNGPNPA